MRVGTIAGKGWLAAACAALMAVLSAQEAAAQAPVQLNLPGPSGRFEVGTRALELVDRKRVDTPGSPGHRRLMVQVTYARAGGAPCEPAPYMPASVQEVLLKALSIYRSGFVATGVCRGGRIARGKRPVLLFSHAFTANRFVYGTLVNDLASRGYVVFAVDHPPDAFAIEYPGGHLYRGKYGPPLSQVTTTADELAELIELRAEDVRFVLRKVLRRSARRSGFLAGRLDPKRVGALGHSLGGATSARAAQLARRIDAAVDIDGSLFGEWTERKGVRTPFLVLAAESGIGSVIAQDRLCGYFGRLRGPRYAWVLDDAAHFSFSDFQSLAPQIAAADPLWVYALLYRAVVGTIDPGVSVKAQREALASFLGRYVKRARGAPEPTPPAPFAELPVGGCSGS